MRLTLINQFYPPDLAPTGHLAASLAEHRAGLGDQVTVITSRGRYVPESRPDSSSGMANPRVIQLWTPGLGKERILNRILDYSVFYLSTVLRALLLPAQDVIISLTTPPFISWAAVLHKRLHPKTRLVLWSMDCYPEAAERTGLLRPGGWISRWMRGLNRGLFRRLDHLIPLDQAMEDLLLGQYQPEGETLPSSVIHNWEAAQAYPRDLHPPEWEGIGKLGLEGFFVVLHMGNTGVGHRFETLLDAALTLRDEPFRFLFVGGGQKWPALERTREERGLNNVLLQRYVPSENKAGVLAASHCALITLRDEYTGVISPSKMHANLAMGLPLLYVGPPGSNVDQAIAAHRCGVSLRHGDVDGVVGFLRELMQHPDKRQALSHRARQAFEAAYSDQQALAKWDSVLNALAGT